MDCTYSIEDKKKGLDLPTLFSLGAIVWITCFSSCTKNSTPTEMDKDTFIHISHFRMADNLSFNPQMRNVDYQVYDVKMLGGDLALDTSGDPAIMDSLDQWFDLGNEQTLWALGNHDYSDLDLVQSYTKRPPFYTYSHKKVTFLVLDTQSDFSSYIGEQLAMIQSVVDTLEETKFLILLHHKLNWLYGHPELEPQIDDLANGRLGDCFYCTNPNNFTDEVYPLLKDLPAQGIQVFCIAGDLGYKAKTFYFKTEDDIHFLASGMNKTESDNQIIVFEYDPKLETLDWHFEFLE